MRAPASGRRRQEADAAIALDRGVVTAAGLYLMTGSTSVTLTGTTAWAVLTGWGMWLSHRSLSRQPRNPPEWRRRAPCTCTPHPRLDDGKAAHDPSYKQVTQHLT
jgi:hypothetical protein